MAPVNLAKTRRLQKLLLQRLSAATLFYDQSLNIKHVALIWVACFLYVFGAVNARAAIITPDSQASSDYVISFDDLVQRPDENLLIFELHIGETPISEALFTFEDVENDAYYIPLVDFFSATEFAINVNYDNGSAQGWFISENDDFSLSLKDGSVTIQGKKQFLDYGDVERHEDALYVSLRALEKWFPITLDVNYSKLAIVLQSLRTLPIELKMQRDNARNNINYNDQHQRRDKLVEKPAAPMFTMPFWDVNLQSTYSNNETAQQSFEKRYTAKGASILLGQDASYSVNDTLSDGNTADVRFKMGRTAFENETLFAGITQYEFGDVYTQQMPLIAESNAGRGLYFTNTPAYKSFSSGSNEITLRGDLPVGYQVDIKQNGELLDFTDEADDNGEYIFDDLAVYPGLNVFELVFYGPQGQQHTEEQRVFIPANPTEKGKFEYRVQTIEDDTNLLTERENSDPDTSRRRILAEANYGVTETSSVRAGYARYSMDGEFKNFHLLGGSTSWKGLRLDMSQAFSQTGNATLGLIETVFKGIRLQAAHKNYNKYESEENENFSLSGTPKTESNIRASGLLPFFVFKTMPLTFEASRFTNTNSDQQFEWMLRATKSFQKIRLTSEIDQTIPPEGDTSTDLSFQVSSRLNNISLRGIAQYKLSPESDLQSLRLTSDIPLSEDSKLRLGVSRTGIEDPIYNLTTGLSYDIGSAIIGLNTSYDSDSNFTATIGASFGLSYDALENRPYISSKRLADASGLIAEVYNDLNADKQQTEDEPYLENVGFKVSGTKKEFFTNEDGSVYIPELKSFNRAGVQLDSSTLPNPFMKSLNDDVDYLLRPSQVHKKTYPVVLQGEIDGSISIFRSDDKHPASSVQIDISRGDNQESIISGKSEFDGFFLVADVPMGSLDVAPSAEQLSTLGYCPVKSQPVILSGDEPFATVPYEFVLFPDPAKVETNKWLVLSKDLSFDDAITLKDSIRAPKHDNDLNAIHTKYVLHTDRNDYVIVSGPYKDLQSIRVCDAYNQNGKICHDIVTLGCDDLGQLQCVAEKLGFVDVDDNQAGVQCPLS